MTGEVEQFRAELRAAGQPWSRMGVIAIAAGIAMLVVVQLTGQIAPFAAYFFGALGLAGLLLAAGWVSMIVAFVKRRRWARLHPLIIPSLSDVGQEAAQPQ